MAGRLSREMKHGASQEPIRLSLVTASIGFEPCQDIRIQAHRYWFFERPIELANFSAAPIQDLRGIREVNVCVSFCGDGSHLSFLLLCELLHKLSFRVILRRGPK